MGDSLAFSVLNRRNFLELASKTEFDFVFTSCGFKEALFCLLATEMGRKCAIISEHDFTCQLNNIVDKKNSGSKSILTLRNQFPHLILPDEYIHISQSSPLKKILPGNIKTKDLHRYESAIKVREGELVAIDKEFKLDTQRLLLSILKNAVAKGVMAFNHMKMETPGDNLLPVVDTTGTKDNAFSLRYKHLLHFHNDELEQEKELHILIDKKNLLLKRSLKFHLKGEMVRLIRYQDYFLLKTKQRTDEHQWTHQILERLNEILNVEINFTTDDILYSEEIKGKEQVNLKNELDALEKFTKIHLGLSSSEFINQISAVKLQDTQFDNRSEIQDLIEFADFRFDEAKQTGVHPVSFKNMFYRFGSDMDILTEKAYELRPQFGPRQELWEYVQLWYVFHYEMISSEADYLNRLRKNNFITDLDLAGSPSFRMEKIRELTENML